MESLIRSANALITILYKVLGRQLHKPVAEAHLVSAREELFLWRRSYAVDYKGQPLPTIRCGCGVELQPWPYKETGLWCATFGDFVLYTHDNKSSSHDIYDWEGRCVHHGLCQKHVEDPSQIHET